LSGRRNLHWEDLRVGSSRAFLGILFVLAAVMFFTGCSKGVEVPVGDAAENIRKLALGYVQYAAQHGGTGPKNRESLAKFLVERSGYTREDADKSFVSPRDNQPYVIRWGQSPLGPMGPEVEMAKANILIFERTGADGVRYTADGRMAIRQMTEAELEKEVPDLSSLVKN
jgi:hypothetical protein